MNYTVFDVETANSQRDSICAIGVIRYENNQVVYEKDEKSHCCGQAIEGMYSEKTRAMQKLQ